MKKIITISIVGILLITAFGAVAGSNSVLKINDNNEEKRDYTHTVFIEVGTGQFCGPCHSWNTALYNTYHSGQYDFIYVEMIIWGFGGWSDYLNTQANTWRLLYGINSIPTSIMDGNYQQIVGNYPAQLPSKLNACGSRTVPDIEAELTLSWLGNATLQMDMAIHNNEATEYNGYIRMPITEIISRYKTSGGSDYHFGFLDYALPMNFAISIPSGGTYTNNITWNGNEHQDNHGTDFGDIDPGNIQVILGVFNDDSDYVDESIAATIQAAPNIPNNPFPANGTTSIDINVDLSWTGGDPNPGDTVTYDVYFGTINPPPKVASNISTASYSPETMDYETMYYWKIISWDQQGASAIGPIWHFTTTNMPNNAPDEPTIFGPDSGKPGNTYVYSIVGTDPDTDEIFGYIDWGDNTTTDWIGPYDSGETFTAAHSWTEKGTYIVQVKVKDEHGAESGWTKLAVTMPTSFSITSPFLTWLFEHFPHAFVLLRHLLGV